MEHALLPVTRCGCQLEHGAAAGSARLAGKTCAYSRAVEIARAVRNECGMGTRAILGPAFEIVEDGFGSSAPSNGGQLVDDTSAARAAAVSHAVEVALRVQDETRIQVAAFPQVARAKCLHHLQRAGRPCAVGEYQKQIGRASCRERV